MMKCIDLSESLPYGPYFHFIFLQLELVKCHILILDECLTDPSLHNLQILVEVIVELRHHLMIFLITQEL